MIRKIFGLQLYLDELLNALFDGYWCSPGMLEGDASTELAMGD